MSDADDLRKKEGANVCDLKVLRLASPKPEEKTMWESSPPRDQNLPNYRIVRTSPKKPMRLICVSHEHQGVRLHYWKGRSTPCKGAHCEACINGHAPRWKGYVIVADTQSPNAAIFEFTERGYAAFERKHAVHGSLRGCIFTTRRLNSKPNGPLLIEFEDARHDPDMLPPDADLRAILERIWEVRQQLLPGYVRDDDDIRACEELRLA